MKKSNCPLCGEKAFYHDIRPLPFTYKEHSIVIQQPGFWCDACGDGVIEGEDAKATREELQEFRSHVDGLLAPTEIYMIRKKVLKLTQQQAANIFGGGPNAFSRYERGEVAPSRSLSTLLLILKQHPELLDETVKRDSANAKVKQKNLKEHMNNYKKHKELRPQKISRR